MNDLVHQLAVYLHLASASHRRQRLLVRDRFLVLAGDAAAQLKLTLVAAHCRHLVLDHNPNHLLRRWATLGDAESQDDFRTLVRQLRRRYPIERAERLLETLGIELARERHAYFADEEYAAALLGTTPQQLQRLYGTRDKGDADGTP